MDNRVTNRVPQFQTGRRDLRELAKRLKSHHSIRQANFFIDDSIKL